jgi:hypothetical protein
MRNPRPAAEGHDLFGRTVATVVSLIGDGVHLQVAPGPATGTGRPATGTVQSPFLRDSLSHGDQAGPVAVGAETDQISSAAFRALDTMSNAGCHATDPSRSIAGARGAADTIFA